MRIGGRNVQPSEAVIWLGVLLGVLDWFTDGVYYAQAKFASDSLESACLTFIFFQPLWYIFMFIVYIASHEHIEDRGERGEKMCLAVPYAVLQQLKLLGSFDKTNMIIFGKFLRRDQFLLFNLENSYRVQIVIELVLEAFPQIIIQAMNNNQTRWDDRAIKLTSFLVSVAVLVKNVAILTVFFVRTVIERRESVQMRPQSYQVLQNVPKIDRLSMASMKLYLQDNSIEKVDLRGNNQLHQLVAYEKAEALEEMALENPQQLFMLNK